MKKKIMAMLLCFTMIFSMAGCAGKAKKDLKINIGSAPGPVTYPLAQMADQNSDIILKPWQSGEQLTSMLTSKEVQLCSTPVSNALFCYNKGLDVKMLMVTVWGMLYVMSTESEVKTLQDLKGKEVVISGKGGIHDMIFRHLLIKNNIDPEKDLKITYMDMSEASTLITAGKIKYAVLNEPQSSIASLNAKKGGIQLSRVVDLTKEWNKLSGQEGTRLPMAGIVVVNGSGITSEQITTFEKTYIDTAKWVNNNAEAIGPIVEKHVPSMKAAAVSQSIKYSRLQPEHAKDCQKEVTAFFKELSETADTKVFGGKLPDAGFYY
ncbi:MAG: ABC transporter substrate-binding protein [Clostridiaceae bacterium]